MANPEETSEPKDKSVDIGLKRDQAFQRFFLKRVQYGREFKITYISGRERVGYITAFDEYNLQISTKAERKPAAVLIPLSAIEDIEETGNGLDSLPPGVRDQIKEYSEGLRAQCVRESERQKKSST